MAFDIQDFDGQVNPIDSDYPNGDIKDNTGGNNGTRMNRKAFADIFQFFVKMMTEAGITHNGLPDNEYNGNQFFEALRKSCLPYDYYAANIFQNSTSAPVATELSDNTLTGIVWTRTGVGTYVGTKTSAFASLNLLLIVSGTTLGFIKLDGNDADTVHLTTKNTSGAAADGILDNVSLEIRVY